MKKSKGNIEVSLTIIATIMIMVMGIIVYVFPEQSTDVSNNIFNFMINYLGSGYLIATFIALSLLVWLAFSKYGNIKFGQCEPEFSKPKFFSMMICAGFGSATLYWCLVESLYYFTAPPYGVEPLSNIAAEWSLTYTFMHWGPSAWAIYAIGALPICISYYVKNNNSMKLSVVFKDTLGKKTNKTLLKIVDLLFYFTTIAAASMALGLSIEPISRCLEELMGIEPSVWMSILIIVIIGLILVVSSYRGINKGMSKISDLSIILCVLFIGIVFIVGPKLFTIDMVTNSVGMLIDNFIKMSFWTDPIDRSGFPQNWTVFYFAYWVVFAPSMGVFIARISKGHTLKDIIIMTIVAGSLGSIFMHGVLQSYTLNLELTGALDASGMLLSGQDGNLVLEIIKTLPMPNIMIFLYFIVAILFMVTTLDGCAYSLTSVSVKKLDKDGNPPKMFRLYWCMLLTVFPLILTIVNAPINTIKSIALILGTPIALILIVMTCGSVKIILSKYKDKSSDEIKANN